MHHPVTQSSAGKATSNREGLGDVDRHVEDGQFVGAEVGSASDLPPPPVGTRGGGDYHSGGAIVPAEGDVSHMSPPLPVHGEEKPGITKSRVEPNEAKGERRTRDSDTGGPAEKVTNSCGRATDGCLRTHGHGAGSGKRICSEDSGCRRNSSMDTAFQDVTIWGQRTREGSGGEEDEEQVRRDRVAQSLAIYRAQLVEERQQEAKVPFRPRTNSRTEQTCKNGLPESILLGRHEFGNKFKVALPKIIGSILTTNYRATLYVPSSWARRFSSFRLRVSRIFHQIWGFWSEMMFIFLIWDHYNLIFSNLDFGRRILDPIYRIVDIAQMSGNPASDSRTSADFSQWLVRLRSVPMQPTSFSHMRIVNKYAKLIAEVASCYPLQK